MSDFFTFNVLVGAKLQEYGNSTYALSGFVRNNKIEWCKAQEVAKQVLCIKLTICYASVLVL